MVPFHKQIVELCEGKIPITRSQFEPSEIMEQLENSKIIEKLSVIRVLENTDYDQLKDELDSVISVKGQDQLIRKLDDAATKKTEVTLDDARTKQIARHLVAAEMAVYVYQVKDAAAFNALKPHQVGCSNLKALSDLKRFTELDVKVYAHNLQTLSDEALGEHDFDRLKTLVAVPCALCCVASRLLRRHLDHCWIMRCCSRASFSHFTRVKRVSVPRTSRRRCRHEKSWMLYSRLSTSSSLPACAFASSNPIQRPSSRS